jgi:hypothetical protein
MRRRKIRPRRGDRPECLFGLVELPLVKVPPAFLVQSIEFWRESRLVSGVER